MSNEYIFVPAPMGLEPWQWADGMATALPDVEVPRMQPGGSWRAWAEALSALPELQDILLPSNSQYADFPEWAEAAYASIVANS